MSITQKNILAKIIRWTVRILSAIMCIIIIMFLFGEGVTDYLELTVKEILLFLGFFVILIGLITGWFREKLGGILILSGFVFFEAINLIFFGFFAFSWVFAMFPLLGILFLIAERK